VKISIARLKEIIMEEVARATAIEEEDVPGSEGYEADIEAEKKKKKEAAERARQDYYRREFEREASASGMREESLNIEIVDDE